LKLKNSTKCVNSRISRYLSFVVPPQSRHAMSAQFRCTTLGFPLSLGFKNDTTAPIGSAKNQHSASICTCHRKKSDLFLRYKPDWHMCDLCSALSLWYSNRIKPLCHCTIDCWFRKLLSGKNRQN